MWSETNQQINYFSSLLSKLFSSPNGADGTYKDINGLTY